jgi:hypothetical protein
MRPWISLEQSFVCHDDPVTCMIYFNKRLQFFCCVCVYITTESQSQSYVRPTVQLASPSWNKAPIWGLRPDLYYCQTVAGLLIWCALSDERTGLSFARLSLLSVCTICILQVTKCMYIQHIVQGLFHFRLSIADHALFLSSPCYNSSLVTCTVVWMTAALPWNHIYLFVLQRGIQRTAGIGPR